jgi:drug/metabolite transporter (DMT)-like permease
MFWALYSIIAAIMWGVAYTMLVPVSENLQTYTIYTIYGFFTCLTNLIIIACNDTFNNFKLIDNWSTAIYLAFYVALSIAASIVFLLGYGAEGINPGVYIMLSNAYAVITFVLSYFFFGKTNVNPYYAIFGICLTFIGCGLLALAKK